MDNLRVYKTFKNHSHLIQLMFESYMLEICNIFRRYFKKNCLGKNTL